VQGNRRRAADLQSADRREDDGPPAVTSSRIGGVNDAKTLDDAAVSDLLEGVPAYDPLSNAEVAVARKSDGEPKSVAAKGPPLAPALMSVALVSITIFAFVCVAAAAPGTAKILFVLFVLVIPFAVASVLREQATLDETAKAQPQDSPEGGSGRAR
jgi:hypothetical protein